MCYKPGDGEFGLAFFPPAFRMDRYVPVCGFGETARSEYMFCGAGPVGAPVAPPLAQKGILLPGPFGCAPPPPPEIADRGGGGHLRP